MNQLFSTGCVQRIGQSPNSNYIIGGSILNHGISGTLFSSVQESALNHRRYSQMCSRKPTNLHEVGSKRYSPDNTASWAVQMSSHGQWQTHHHDHVDHVPSKDLFRVMTITYYYPNVGHCTSVSHFWSLSRTSQVLNKFLNVLSTGACLVLWLAILLPSA